MLCRQGCVLFLQGVNNEEAGYDFSGCDVYVISSHFKVRVTSQTHLSKRRGLALEILTISVLRGTF